MARGKRIVLIIIAALFVVIFSLTSMTGLFVVNPIAGLPEGETIWYYRRGTGLPMISSGDGLNGKYGNGVSLDSRTAMNAKIASIIGTKVIAKLPYVKFLYMMSTGNKDFSGLGSPRTAPSVPAAPSLPAAPLAAPSSTSPTKP